MSFQYFLTRLRTRQGSVFNVTVFNKMCELSLARMHAVHLPSDLMVAASHQGLIFDKGYHRFRAYAYEPTGVTYLIEHCDIET